MAPVFGVLGYPLAQSASPFLHSRAFAKAGIAAAYTAWEIAPEHLAAFMRDFRRNSFQGASVTIPHKEAVMPFVDAVTESAKTIGAVNTLYREGGKLRGHNTDMEGFIEPLLSRPIFPRAVVLGAGGAARAVLAGLSRLGVARVTLLARDKRKSERLAADFAPAFSDVATPDWENRDETISGTGGPLLVVNTTPLGMRGKSEGHSALQNDDNPRDAGFVKARPLRREPAAAIAASASAAGCCQSTFGNSLKGRSPLSGAAFRASRPEERLAYDIVYNPPETAFLVQARTAGWQTVGGLAMFVGQAAAQFRLWTGQDMDAGWARALLAAKFAHDCRENAEEGE